MKLNGFDYNEGCSENYAVESIGAYTVKTFAWMFLGLLATFGVALFGYATGTILYLFAIPYFHLVLLVAELAVVIFLSARIHKLSIPAARTLFFAYAVLILVFAMTAVYFGGMALYGYLTKTDLSRLRPVLIGGLLFLIVFGLLSLFIPMAGVERVVCLAGVAIFLGFTAYDTQKIQTYYRAYQSDAAMLERASIISALQLYLDFINLFLYLLRFLGKSRK